MTDKLKFDFVIIGGGIIGLSIGKELSKYTDNLLVLEKEPYLCNETSSRNSEVIHSGIYYPIDTLKSKLCIEGKSLLYELLESQKIEYKKIGKLIIAKEKEEREYLNQLNEQAIKLNIPVELLGKSQLMKVEPNVKAEMALYSPTTGIFDSHKFSQHLSHFIEEMGATIMKNNEVIDIRPENKMLELKIKDASNNLYTVSTQVAINCAGLYAHKIANLYGANFKDFKPYEIEYWRGNYFKYHGSLNVNHLIYPTPRKSLNSLGIHLTLDLKGNAKFGPDLEMVQSVDYSNNSLGLKNKFVDAINYMNIDNERLSWDYSGIRPKLKTKGDGFKDFYIKKEGPNFVNLLGIESPGLTSCLAIAKKVTKFII